MKETPFFFWIKLIILVVILTFGFGILVGGIGENDHTNTVSIGEE
jgi:ABC-type multidrug transport system permease subunit